MNIIQFMSILTARCNLIIDAASCVSRGLGRGLSPVFLSQRTEWLL